MTDPDPLGPEADVAAAELALGLLDGEERAAALRRQLAEPGFARAVERWREQFALLFAAIPEVAPPADLGERIVGRLDGREPPRAGFWKPLAFASSLAAAGLLGVILLQPESVAPVAPVPVERPAPLVAAVTMEGRDAPMVAVYDAAAGSVRLDGALDVPTGRSAQLWAIVEGDPNPHPLGLFEQAGTGAMVAAAPAPRPMAPGTTLAISIEPLGGSPTGAPTGPVVASGTLSQI